MRLFLAINPAPDLQLRIGEATSAVRRVAPDLRWIGVHLDDVLRCDLDVHQAWIDRGAAMRAIHVPPTMATKEAARAQALMDLVRGQATIEVQLVVTVPVLV